MLTNVVGCDQCDAKVNEAPFLLHINNAASLLGVSALVLANGTMAGEDQARSFKTDQINQSLYNRIEDMKGFTDRGLP